MRIRTRLFAAVLAASAVTPAPGADANPERGWFWGFFETLQEAVEEKFIELPVVPPEPLDPEAQERDCTDPEQWDVECGFVDPKGDFRFQSLQRDALLSHATMNPQDPRAVEGFQRYMHWAVNQAITMARTWQWNMIQNQDLNPRAHTPVSAFGLRAALRVEEAHQASVLAEIKAQGGFLVWFTRTTCPYCHDMRDTMLRVSRASNLTVWNAALDGECMEGFEEYCRGGPDVINAARRLNIAAVPDLWLYLPEDDVWLRISSGIESVETINNRMELFFGAIRRAAIRGIKNSAGEQRPSVDFSPAGLLESSKGGTAAAIIEQLEQ